MRHLLKDRVEKSTNGRDRERNLDILGDFQDE